MRVFPESARVDKKIPKTKFYEKLGANQKLKNLFIQKVETIQWLYKLSPAQLKIEKTPEIEEIHVFSIELRGDELPEEVLRQIDQAIPYPILFVLKRAHEVCLRMGYKEVKPAVRIRGYFGLDWQPQEEVKWSFSLQGKSTMEEVYEGMLRSLFSQVYPLYISLAELIKWQEQKKELEKQVERLEAHVVREKQFNKQVALNIELQKKQKELAQWIAQIEEEDKWKN